MSQYTTLSLPWNLLGVSRNCSAETLKSAYKKRLLQHHPDKFSGRGHTADFLFEKKIGLHKSV